MNSIKKTQGLFQTNPSSFSGLRSIMAFITYASDDSDADDVDIEANMSYHMWRRVNAYMLAEERYLLTLQKLHKFRWKFFWLPPVPPRPTHQKINNEFQRLIAREDFMWNYYISVLRERNFHQPSKENLCDNIESRLAFVHNRLRSDEGGERWYAMHRRAEGCY